MTSTNYLGLKRSGHAFYRMTNQGLDPAVVGDGMTAIEEEDDWYPTWTRVAERYEEAARHAQAASRTVSAAQLWTKASLAFHFAQYLHFSNLAQKEAAASRKVECFNAALPLHAIPGMRLEAAFEGRSLPIVFRTPHPQRKLPLALLVCGSDSSKEEHFRIENQYLARGMATVSFDGPGQGEFARFMAMRPDYHRAVSAVIGRVGLLDQVDAGRIGVVGFGFGGLLAVSAACHDPRVRACVSVSGYFDMSVMDWDDTIRANRFRHLVGTDSIAHARQQAEQFSLAPCIARLDRPLLVMHGARDAGIPEEAAQRIATEARGPTDYVCVEGGVHCFHNVAWRAQPLMTDWLHDKLTATA